jgi:hypothetical protein
MIVSKLLTQKIQKRRLFELLALFVFSLAAFAVFQDGKQVVFFVTGFIWNWSAYQRLDYVFEKPKYRLSFLKMVYNLHYLFQYPLKKFPLPFRILARTLPCGLFLLGLNHFFDSKLNVLASFAGSFLFELFQFDLFFNNKERIN